MIKLHCHGCTVWDGGGACGPTHLIAHSVVLGLNHCPTFFLSSFLAKVMFTLNGYGVDDESTKYTKIST